ncbi:MAG: hypothetical protein QW040_02425 [Candidatus Aenigmatarchaeota archaeon]
MEMKKVLASILLFLGIIGFILRIFIGVKIGIYILFISLPSIVLIFFSVALFLESSTKMNKKLYWVITIIVLLLVCVYWTLIELRSIVIYKLLEEIGSEIKQSQEKAIKGYKPSAIQP